MSQKVNDARRAIAEIELQATRIKEEIKILIDNDARMKYDEAHRNQVVGERLREVQKLQDLSQGHQRTILRHKETTSAELPRRMTTRSSGSGPTGISAVALNMQQMTRQAARSSPVSREDARITQKASEEQQKASVMSLHNTRNWLLKNERLLMDKAQNEGLPGFEDVSQELLEEYANFRSIRIRTEDLCELIRKNPSDESALQNLREVIKFVASYSEV